MHPISILDAKELHAYADRLAAQDHARKVYYEAVKPASIVFNAATKDARKVLNDALAVAERAYAETMAP